MSNADDLQTAIDTLKVNVADMARAKTVAYLNLTSVVGSTATVSTNGTRAGWKATLKTWSLAWGDGAVSNGSGVPPMSLTHGYATSGNESAVLAVTDSKGITAKASKNIVIGSPTLYTLTVVNGSGSGVYVGGTVVIIIADAAPTGYGFDQWAGGVVADQSRTNTTVTMTFADLTLTATYVLLTPPPPPTPPTYTLTIVSGSGSGDYVSGVTVPIVAFTPAAGQTFATWTGATVADATNSNTTLVMPAATTSVTATYTSSTVPPSFFALTVVSGSGSGNYAAGATVPIFADPAPTDYVFSQWVGSADIINPPLSSTTLIMPSADTTVTATYALVGPPPPPPPPPPPLTGLGFVTLSWVAVAGATGYNVLFGTSSGVYDTTIDVGNVLTSTVYHLTSGTTYFFVIQSYASGGTSTPSAEVSVTAP